MPFKSNSELPKGVKSHLPEHGQDIWREAYNNALKQYGQEDRAAKVAWAAVEKDYTKSASGAWTRKVAATKATPKKTPVSKKSAPAKKTAAKKTAPAKKKVTKKAAPKKKTTTKKAAPVSTKAASSKPKKRVAAKKRVAPKKKATAKRKTTAKKTTAKKKTTASKKRTVRSKKSTSKK